MKKQFSSLAGMRPIFCYGVLVNFFAFYEVYGEAAKFLNQGSQRSCGEKLHHNERAGCCVAFGGGPAVNMTKLVRGSLCNSGCGKLRDS